MKLINAMLLLLLIPSCSMNAFMAIGHRGASGYEPENTLRAFNRAIDMNVDMIELDVHCCASGELVVIHDETLERTTNGTGLVVDHTLQRLKQLDAGLGERIPTLAEVFDLVNRGVIINIELKGKGTAIPTAQLIQNYVSTRGWLYDDFLVSSFDIEELGIFTQQMKSVKIGVLCEEAYVPWEACAELKASVMGIATWQVTQHIVDVAHAKGLKLYVFTVNDKDTIDRLKHMGVDGIFSNYPDLF